MDNQRKDLEFLRRYQALVRTNKMYGFWEGTCHSQISKGVLECKLQDSDYCPRSCNLYPTASKDFPELETPEDDGTVGDGVHYGGI